MAVGLSLKKEIIEGLKKDINEYVRSLNLEETQQVIEIDMEVALKDLNIQIVKELNKLEPFGEANKIPNFIIKNLKIDSIRALTEGKHLKLSLKDENSRIDAIGFNLGELTNEYKLNDKVDIVGNLEINSYNGIESIQMNLKDMKKSL